MIVKIYKYFIWSFWIKIHNRPISLTNLKLFPQIWLFVINFLFWFLFYCNFLFLKQNDNASNVSPKIFSFRKLDISFFRMHLTGVVCEPNFAADFYSIFSNEFFVLIVFLFLLTYKFYHVPLCQGTDILIVSKFDDSRLIFTSRWLRWY